MGKPELFVTPAITVHPNQIVTYANVQWSPYKPQRPETSLRNLKHNQHDGTLSKSAQKKLNRSTDYLIALAQPKSVTLPYKGKYWKFRLSFITLTLSSDQIHTDQELKKLFLNHFIVEAREKWNLNRYVWRAERQKNGNLHFHILSDTFIPWYELQNTWNRIQNKLGYVDRYRDKMIEFHKTGFRVRTDLLKQWPVDQQKKAFLAAKKKDFRQPNSTDIHSVRHIRDIRQYVAKYMSKKDGELPINGRIWGCSYDISSPMGARGDIDNIISSELGRIRNQSTCHVIEGEYFTLFYITPDEILKCEAYTIHSMYTAYMKQFDNST